MRKTIFAALAAISLTGTACTTAEQAGTVGAVGGALIGGAAGGTKGALIGAEAGPASCRVRFVRPQHQILLRLPDPSPSRLAPVPRPVGTCRE